MEIIKIKNNNMKNILKNYIYLSLFFALSLTLSSCYEDDTVVLDAPKVIPNITDLNGPTIKFVEETGTYSVTPRGGSEFIWEVTGAQAQPISGSPHMINVFYNQSDDLVSVSVFERAANGKESEKSSIEGIKVFGTPCDWTLEMQDAFGDGWNGASLSFNFDGFAADVLTIDDSASASATIAVPNGSNVEVTFNSGDWDGEVSYQLYDGSGALVMSKLAYDPTFSSGVQYSEINTCP